ncbi:MAG TPA: TIGR01777 family oxidoreductase [Solirubrobacteraceae bacterium]|nr:TIGR01777 family oxidoreductase [Solirubrobacteraceae bacterium]
MKVALTGASGLIGHTLVRALCARGDEVTILTRDPERAPRAGVPAPRSQDARPEPELVRWSPVREPAPARALAGQDAVVHLAGEPIAQRWNERVKRAIRDSRVLGTRNLVSGIAAVDQPDRPRALLSASAIGYYGPHGPEPIDEEAPAGSDFLARVCAAWESEAGAARELGVRTVALRTGVVLDRSGGALAQMLTPFRLGLGGRVGSGEQYMAWVHPQDVIEIVLAALADERWSGPVNLTAPEPVTAAVFARSLGRALHRPAALAVPAFALRMRYGEMASVLTNGVRALPARALMLGYTFAHPSLPEALRAALA